ncbi:MAG: ribonucleotide-diphosphate reductase subunit beta [Solirubrobacterales bacterium]|nr:ribonucleotide-diphosphate reductase subunit beta [Solirubrobacterales bacterium]HMT05823.1 ribonucleotide-diphosphate reductase subunit beta [Solirubrobacterales bacterium]
MSVAQTEPGSNRTGTISYMDLYRRWEEGNWSVMELDFSADRVGWEALTELQRSSALWMYSMFFYGEDSVADNLSPYIDAAPTEEQAYFLTTQQVDEARHAVLFHRFFNEVLEVEGSIGSTLEATLPQLNWGYRGVFDRLDRMADELRADRSLPRFAQAITLYHLVVEGTLAQPGQHYIEDFFNKDGGMPGFSAGMVNVSRDEQRHIGFGVKTLSEIVPQSEECKAAIVELFREINRYSVGVFCPPAFDRSYTECWGFSLEDIYAFGLKLVRQRWKTIGFPLEEMPDDIWPFDHSLSAEEIAKSQVKLLLAGVTGAPHPSPDSSPEIQGLLFDMTTRRARTDEAGKGPFKVQWDFTDATPWNVVVDNGSTRADPGSISDPDLTLKTSWTEWVGIALNNRNPLRAIAERRLTPKGSPRALNTFRKVFPPI